MYAKQKTRLSTMQNAVLQGPKFLKSYMVE